MELIVRLGFLGCGAIKITAQANQVADQPDERFDKAPMEPLRLDGLELTDNNTPESRFSGTDTFRADVSLR